MNVTSRASVGQVHPHLVRCIAAIAIVVTALPMTGCRLCSNCEIGDYSAYGGSWDRTRREGGRVGSIFDPGGVQLATLVDRDDPPTAEQLERQRQAEDPDAIRERAEDKRRMAEQDEEDRLREERDSEDDEDRRKRDEERDRELDELDIEDIEVSIQDIPLPMLD